jgi:hypothetical protein
MADLTAPVKRFDKLFGAERNQYADNDYADG